MGIPLDPKNGGQCISDGALEAADILVSTTSAFSSAVIRVGTWSDVSHARLYVGGGEVAEAVGEGVRIVRLEQAMDHDSLCVAYRYPYLTPEQAQAMRYFVKGQVGKKYNYNGVIGQGVQTAWDVTHPVEAIIRRRSQRGREVQETAEKDQFFCSQLVFAAFQHAGIRLTTSAPSASTPQELVKLQVHGKLDYVGHLKVLM